MAVLSGVDEHDLYTGTFGSALLQRGCAAQAKRRAAAPELLPGVAQKLRSPRLAVRAYQVKWDAFTRVKEAIEDRIAQHAKDKADEIKHEDFCVGSSTLTSCGRSRRI